MDLSVAKQINKLQVIRSAYLPDSKTMLGIINSLSRLLYERSEVAKDYDESKKEEYYELIMYYNKNISKLLNLGLD